MALSPAAKRLKNLKKGKKSDKPEMDEKDDKCDRCGAKNSQYTEEEMTGWEDEDIESEVEEIW